ncbi:MAG: pyruvate kinase [Clostridium sp.]|nr:pyruvate kinase [Clostridium sp.]MCM1444004.1 pyruvate kinase [Candidatus Amulumruptor caecigallinarius]
MKKTKIICSIGPSTQTWENFKGLVDAGMNVARINFSHATMEERKLDESLVERARKEMGANIAILYDTKGPDLRTCTFEGDYIELVKGNTIRIVEEDLKDNGNKERISFNYRNIIKNLKIGQEILLDDGFYKLIVISKEEDGVTCEIENSGTIKSRRGVCIPGVNLDVPYVSEKDKEDIKYACDMDGDYLAISFVNTADNIREVRALCKEFGKPNMPIISKVETQFAMGNLKEIVTESDYIMIARGDLGVETGVENLPLYQQMMIDECHSQGKGVIMATQMMTSMKHNIRPTNAEVTDVSNAVLRGCDAIMTSDETTMGEYPVETIQAMSKIAINAELIANYSLKDYKLIGTDIHNTIAKCVVEASKELPIKAIVASTLNGKTAIDLSSLRPNSFIVAAVTNEKVARSLALKWGVYSTVIPTLHSIDEVVSSCVLATKDMLELKSGDLVSVVGSIPEEAHTNFMKIEEIA